MPTIDQHPKSCCCWPHGWPTPTLEISYANDYGLSPFGTGYSGSNLFVEESWGNNPNFFYEDLFGPDRSGSITTSGAPVGNFGLCSGQCPSYNYEHVNNFVDDAEEYEDPKDKCWDWNELSVEFDHNNIMCASSTYNPAIQIPDPNDPNQMIPDPERLCECGNWDTRTSTRTVICGFFTPNVVTPPNPTFCPPQSYGSVPSSGENWCGGSVFDINAPNITREFKKAFIDDGIIGRDPAELAYGDYQYAGGLSSTPFVVHLSRSKRDHRKNWRKAKLRIRFIVPPTCYLKIWTKAKITTLNTSENSCYPDAQISEEIYDFDPVEWVGTAQNCKGASGYPFTGDTETIDIINSISGNNEFAFFEEGEPAKYVAPEKTLGVTAGHRKSMSFAFKYSMIPNYEPEWGCMTAYVEETGDVCRVFDPFDEGAGATNQSCLDTNGLPTPLCHYV